MPRSTQTLFPTTQSGAISFSGEHEGTARIDGGPRLAGGGGGGRVKEAAMEKDQEPRSAKRSEREGRQFFKIKAVKPNLQVCRRKRVEVVKILVVLYPCSPPSSPAVSPLLSFHSCFSTHPSCAFRATSSAPLASLAGG